MKIEIFAPSYRRPSGISTQVYLPQCTYVVAKSEKKIYEKHGHRVWAVPDSAQGNLCRIRNYILDNCGPNVLLLDDDLARIQRWDTQKIKRLDSDQAMEFIEHGFILAKQMGVRYWGLNCLPDKAAYREYTPFALRSYIGGPFQAFLNMDLRYDESLPLKEDYDMTLQVCNKYRKALRFNMYNYVAKQHTNEGGCAVYRTMDRERDQFLKLQQKWGSDIVRMDTQGGQVNQRKRTNWDINPIVRVPIAGV